MVDFADLPLDFRFFGIIIRLPVFPVVIVGIRADPQPPQQPADAEFFLRLKNKGSPFSVEDNNENETKPACQKLYAVKQGKYFIWRQQAFSRLSLRNSFMLSYSVLMSGLVWHSLLNSLHHLEILALDTPYSAGIWKCKEYMIVLFEDFVLKYIIHIFTVIQDFTDCFRYAFKGCAVFSGKNCTEKGLNAVSINIWSPWILLTVLRPSTEILKSQKRELSAADWYGNL